MQNIIHSRAGQPHGIEIENVGLTKFDLIRKLRKIFAFAGGKIVHPANLFAATHQFARQRRSNESANASD